MTSNGPFDTLEATFRVLCTEPRPLALDGCSVPGLPAREIPLDELRSVLLHPSTSYSTRDAALSCLLGDARDHGGAATVGLAGVLLFGLRRAVGPLRAACPARAADLEAEALAGLLEAIAVTEPGRPRLAARLCWLARNRAKRLLDAEVTQAARHATRPDAGPPRLPCGHPDLVLAQAAAEEVIAGEDAALIGDTRLGEYSVAQAAGALGISEAAARKRRWRAERTLTAWLRSDRYQPHLFVQSAPRTPYLTGEGRPRGGTRTPAARSGISCS